MSFIINHHNFNIFYFPLYFHFILLGGLNYMRKLVIMADKFRWKNQTQPIS